MATLGLASTSFETNSRVAARPLDSLDWTFTNHPDPFSVPRVGAGFSEESETLVVAMLTLDSELAVALFDADGNSLALRSCSTSSTRSTWARGRFRSCSSCCSGSGAGHWRVFQVDDDDGGAPHPERVTAP
jgi:hypothetical protein